MKIHGLHDDWNATDEGDAACYAVPPELVPALERAVDAVSQAARVIYELRLEITRLNDEVMARGLEIARLNDEVMARGAR